MEVTLDYHAVREGVHGSECHVDGLTVDVVLGSVIFLKADAASSRCDQDGRSSVGEQEGVAKLAKALGVVLAWGLRHLAFHILLTLIFRLVESIDEGLQLVRSIRSREPFHRGRVPATRIPSC